MQQEMLRIQAELESTLGRRLGRRRRRQGDRHRQAGAGQRHHRPVRGRPGRRRDAPGPGRRGGQRRARASRDGRGEDGRRDRRAPPARDVGSTAPGGQPRHRAGRPADRGVRPPARDRPQDRPAPDLPPAAGAGRRGADPGGRPHRRPRQGRLLRALLQHQRPAALPDLPRPGPRHDRGCASSRSRSTSSPSSGRASSRASTTSSTARSRRSTGSAPTGCAIRELLARADEAARDGEPFVEVILATNPTLEGEATAMYLAERLEHGRRRGQPDRPRPAGRRRPRVRRRGDPDPRPPGPAGGLSRRMSNLVFEILLRLAKAGVAAGPRRSSSTWSSSARSAPPARSSWRCCAGSAGPRSSCSWRRAPSDRGRRPTGRRRVV